MKHRSNCISMVLAFVGCVVLLALQVSAYDLFSSGSNPSDVVVSLDRSSAFVSIPDDNVIVEFAGFPSE